MLIQKGDTTIGISEELLERMSNENKVHKSEGLHYWDGVEIQPPTRDATDGEKAVSRAVDKMLKAEE